MCEIVKLGETTAIICGGRHAKKKCRWCGSPADLLCDFPLAEGKTCDAPMCEDHATGKAANVDYCPNHREHSYYRRYDDRPDSAPDSKLKSSMWPATAEELSAAGWVDQHKQKWCTCGAVLFWFLTPQRRWIPLEVVNQGDPPGYRPHHANCRDVKNFRTAKRPDPKAAQSATAQAQKSFFS